MYLVIICFFSNPNRAPGQKDLNEWPKYTVTEKSFLRLDERFLRDTEKPNAIDGGPSVHQCAFWRHYLPKLVISTGKFNSLLPW